MKAKWCFNTLIVILALFGVCQEQTTLPNQQIILQFANAEVTTDEFKNALTIVKKQLKTIGVDNIQVRKQDDGGLRISYYSTTDVAGIKRMLSKEKQVKLGYVSNGQDDGQTKSPSDKKLNSYNLDVYEIQSGADAGAGLGGKYVFELKQEYDRFSNPNLYTYLPKIELGERNKIVKAAYRINRNIAIAIDNTSHNIPEVRAGPYGKRNS